MEIPQELLDFKASLDGKKDNMSSTAKSIQDKTVDISNETDRVKSGIDSNYESANKSSLINRLNKLSNTLNKVDSSISADLNPIITKSYNVVDNVKELETMIENVKELEIQLNDEKSKKEEERNSANISDYESKISDIKTKFTTLCNDTKSLFNELKGMDGSLSFVSDFSSTDYTSKLDQLNYGTFEHMPIFTASNGTQVEYYLYLPDYGEEVEGLPLHVYFPGSGEANGSGALNNGLGYLIKEQAVTPEGACIIIQGHNNYDNPNYQQAIIELCNYVAEQHNIDTNKISASGHSWGAMLGYSLVKNNPGYFSAFVPISGKDKVGVGYTDTKIWGIHGSRDSNVAYESGVKSVNNIARAGGDAEIYTIEGKGHPIQTQVFQEEYERQDGEVITPLEWAFRQSLEA